MEYELEDLTQYSDSELSQRIFNEEGLYVMRRAILRNKGKSLREFYIFTQAQLDEALADIEADLGQD